MKVERIILFAEVVKHGSFTRAADHLQVSKAFLSQQIKALEQFYDKQLLVRNTRNMRLTSAGEVLFSQSKKLTSFCQETKELLDITEEKLSGMVKCTAPVGLAKYCLSPLFNDIVKNAPDISILIDSGNNLHNLINEDFDFALRLTNTPPQDLVARRLATVNYYCCATPRFIAQKGLPKHPSHLANYDCLVLPHWNVWTFSREEETVSTSVKGKVAASDNDVLKQACLSHVGVARLPDYMIKEQIESGELMTLFPDFTPEQRELHLLYPQMNSRPKRVNICLEKIVDAFKQ